MAKESMDDQIKGEGGSTEKFPGPSVRRGNAKLDKESGANLKKDEAQYSGVNNLAKNLGLD